MGLRLRGRCGPRLAHLRRGCLGLLARLLPWLLQPRLCLLRGRRPPLLKRGLGTLRLGLVGLALRVC